MNGSIIFPAALSKEPCPIKIVTLKLDLSAQQLYTPCF